MHSVDGRLNGPSAAPLDKAHLQAAVQWYLTLNDNGVSPEQQQAWQHWLGADARHARAWARVERLQQQLQGVPQGIALPVLSEMGIQRRQGLKVLLLLAGGTALFGGYRMSPYSADFATHTGQRREVRLDDGSHLQLNTDTRVDIAYSHEERLIFLRRGEIQVTTAVDRASRPLLVVTPHGRVQALGTRFDVRLHAGFSSVSVQRHAVEVRLEDEPQHFQRVDEGQALTFGAGRMGAPRMAGHAESAWVQGQLVAVDWRLADFIRELARYRPGYLGCADEVGELRISGAFRLDDIDGVLANLPLSLPVTVRRFSKYWVRVQA
ncbi:FecR domain-containing protein [Pseudomonas protegens]|uniref:FecR domain-containing protein n=1 Tax=Pseudomonas protegens TaxID=380021 RepID=UPI0031585996